MSTTRRVTLFDIADALGISTGTVHRALHDHPGVNAMTRMRVLQVSKNMGYRPNVAARLLSQKKQFRISVNTLKGTTSFWDEVRGGIQEEAEALGTHGADIEFRTFPSLGEGEEEAFEAAIAAESDGMILFPSRPSSMRTWMRRASRSRIPIVFVSTDAPHSNRLAVVSVDTMASGSLAADLMGRVLNHRGKVPVPPRAHRTNSRRHSKRHDSPAALHAGPAGVSCSARIFGPWPLPRLSGDTGSASGHGRQSGFLSREAGFRWRKCQSRRKRLAFRLYLQQLRLTKRF